MTAKLRELGGRRGCMTGLEPATTDSTGQCSNQLSYMHHLAATLRTQKNNQDITL